ncbi:hypothetical protein [Nostoc sp.]|uniref:hypothetical protein n=1 Tax=Nostoc sp. TaxID=1180 RepID=UPI002FFA1819
MMKQSLKKRLKPRQGRNTLPLTPLELIPAEQLYGNGKSPGNPVVGLATSNGTINLSEGTNKNELWVKGAFVPQVVQTSGGIPTIRVGQTVIGLRCSENTNSRREND